MVYKRKIEILSSFSDCYFEFSFTCKWANPSAYFQPLTMFWIIFPHAFILIESIFLFLHLVSSLGILKTWLKRFNWHLLVLGEICHGFISRLFYVNYFQKSNFQQAFYFFIFSSLGNWFVTISPFLFWWFSNIHLMRDSTYPCHWPYYRNIYFAV